MRPIVALATAAFAAAACDGGAPGGGAGFPPPDALASSSAPVFEDFVGSEMCAACHAERYESWAASTHGRAGGEPTSDVVIAPFDGAPILFSDAEVVPRISPEGVYEFVVRQTGHAELVYRVDGVIGGGHMVGGGTQGFTWRTPDGTERFLPFDWSRHESRWFCNTGTRLDQGWLPVTEEMSLADCGDWPPLRVLGTVDRFGNCQGCHGSQIITDQPVGEMYRTRFTTLRINCESCHGPGRTHVALAQSGSLGFDAETGFASLTTLDEDGSLDLCFQCHALKDVLREGHLPGAPLGDYYALKFPVLGDEPFFPDFRVKTFAYQETHLSSACYLSGSMTCVSCHEPHGQAYQDEFGAPLQGRFDDGQCTSCHASKATNVERHTFHPEGSEGSLCVSCHMPYLQQPEVGPQVAYARSDHTIPVPRPAYDASLGVESACIQCHTDRSPDALAAQTAEWWGTLKPHRPLIQALSDAATEGSDGAAANLALLQPDETDPLAQFKALARYLTRYLGPDQPALATEVEARLTALTASADLDVRALALASLHWTRGSEPEMHRFLIDALATAGGEQDALRRRWVLALSFLGDEARRQADGERAVLAYQKALELLPEDARLLGAIGAALNQDGAYLPALTYLERSLAVNPDHALTRVNLGIAQAALGDVAAATETYASAARANPAEPLAFFNLGNLYLRQSSVREAALSYERALELDPGLARGHYNLALAYIRLERLDDALPRARRALELEPGNEGARQMIMDLEQAVGGE